MKINRISFVVNAFFASFLFAILFASCDKYDVSCESHSSSGGGSASRTTNFPGYGNIILTNKYVHNSFSSSGSGNSNCHITINTNDGPDYDSVFVNFLPADNLMTFNKIELFQNGTLNATFNDVPYASDVEYYANNYFYAKVHFADTVLVSDTLKMGAQ